MPLQRADLVTHIGGGECQRRRLRRLAVPFDGVSGGVGVVVVDVTSDSALEWGVGSR
ncbi:hypothetical protein JYT71_00415 [Acidimicrobiaceae bacterium AH-315-P05]|nr:hypothetical protein [Acidimicrobiaceae bacterium AH-315-P05]